MIVKTISSSRLKKERYISSTKNDKIRVIPLTYDMARVLRKVKEFGFKNGWLGEYVFQDDRGRVYASRISDCAVNNTTTAEFYNKKSVYDLLNWPILDHANCPETASSCVHSNPLISPEQSGDIILSNQFVKFFQCICNRCCIFISKWFIDSRNGLPVPKDIIQIRQFTSHVPSGNA